MYIVYIFVICFIFDIFNIKLVKKFQIYILGLCCNGEFVYYVEIMFWYIFFNYYIVFFFVIFVSDVLYEVVMFKLYIRKEYLLLENLKINR